MPQQAIVESIQLHRRHGDLCIFLHLVRGMIERDSMFERVTTLRVKMYEPLNLSRIKRVYA
jgi:hypothetical protein